ncbi:LysR substrate-binding domain-containing protein [Bradyrhizobium sp. HKCCYLS20291]|uniref:LysR family transcriptional regulator n=1 Tax=Bradyrhizobium sp. HKCCYLS20291 TaxID=3420766 RepID=UPI003EC11085
MNDGRLAAIDALLAVVNTGGFGRAARELGLTQSTVSRRIAQLEAQLGVALLARTTRSVTLTGEGDAYVATVRTALNILRAADASVGSGRTSMAGSVRIAAPTAFGRATLATILAEMAAQYPDLRFELDLSDRYVDLSSGRYDLAIRLSADAPSGWSCDEIGRIAGRLCASPAYLARSGKLASLTDLADHKLLAPKTYAARTRWTFRTGGHAMDVDIVPHMIVSDYTALAHLCTFGCGIAPLPSFLCEAAILDGALTEVLPGRFVADVGVFAASPFNMRKAPRVAMIREAVRRALQARPAPELR